MTDSGASPKPLSAHARLHRAYMRYLETDDGVNSPDLDGFGDSVLRIIRDVFDEHDDMDLEVAALQAQVAELTRERAEHQCLPTVSYVGEHITGETRWA